MPILETLAIVSTGLQVAGHLMQGDSDRARAGAQADALTRQAHEDQIAAEDQSEDLLRRAGIIRDRRTIELASLGRRLSLLKGAQRVGFAKGGVTVSGTPTEIISETERRGKIEELALVHATETEAIALETTAKKALERGKRISEAGLARAGDVRGLGERAFTGSLLTASGALAVGTANVIKINRGA